MIKIVSAKYIYTPKGYKEALSVAFDEKILDIDELGKLKKKYPKAQLFEFNSNYILYPGFINSHTHLEFSANRGELNYGDFMEWLESVIKNRDSLVKEAIDSSAMKDAIDEMLKSGISHFGAISSFGLDLEVCKETPQRVTYFNEIIGSNPASVDILFQDFKNRLELSSSLAKEYKITPAVAIHSPYSVHPILANRVVAIAKSLNLPLSAHFLESSYEREWLERGEGGFREFFEKFFKVAKPLTNIDEFLNLFDNYPTLFVHLTQSSKKELERIKREGHFIAHCPRSNRLLGCKRLEIESIKDLVSLATDGLSSNWSLNIFDELRSALMAHFDLPLKELADTLIESITLIPAKALKSNGGTIEVGLDADLTLIKLPKGANSKDELALNTILYTKSAEALFIAGELVYQQ